MTGAATVDEASKSGTPGIVRVDRPVRAPEPERAKFEASMAKAGYHMPPALYLDGTYRDTCYSAGWDAWQAARPNRAAVGRLVNLAAKLMHQDTMRKLWLLEEQSGRTLGRRASRIEPLVRLVEELG